jgi:hypothetical protein
MKNAFFGFASAPQELVDSINAGIDKFHEWKGGATVHPWTELDGPSVPVVPTILKCIRDKEASFFDISVCNQNVFYEVGYAVGLSKPVYLTINDALKHAVEYQIDLGIFDTHRLKKYRNGNDLANIIRDARQPYQQSMPGLPLDERQPLYFQDHLERIDFAINYFSCLKEQNLGFRSHNPSEDRRLPLDRAFREVLTSAGVFLSLIPPLFKGAEHHNLRAFLLAGIADGCGVPRTILKYGEFVTAFDLRDGVTVVRDRSEIYSAVVQLLPRVHGRQQNRKTPPRSVARAHLMNLSLGGTAAENELHHLDDYFLETREFRRTLRGEARLVVGRKGAGKTAIFWQVRNRIKGNRANLVLDLRPEGFQLRKLSEVIESHFTAATHTHTLTLFWEYVLYLELAHKILEDDSYTRDGRLTDKYLNVKRAYDNVDEIREGDFPERLLQLITRLRKDVSELEIESGGSRILTTPRITELIYRTDFPKLRDIVLDYLSLKKQTLILVDNLDRGWTTAGVSPSDIRIVQCLMDAGRRIERSANKAKAGVQAIIFLRDDVYDWLIAETADRGKESTVRVQWRDVEMLRQLIERRLETASKDLSIEPAIQWSNITQGQIQGEQIFDYLVRHCLRRPRSLLDLIELALSNASLAGRSAISPEDAERAVVAYSSDMLRDLNYEIRDIYPEADKIIYAFSRNNIRLDQKNVERTVLKRLKDSERARKFVRMMFWFGFFGVIAQDRTENYVFDHGDDIELLLSHAGNSQNPILCIHPLFRSALSLRTDLLF